jgi:hypothetical protein
MAAQKGDDLPPPLEPLRRELQKIISHSAVNPEPVTYWGGVSSGNPALHEDDPSTSVLAHVFRGRTKHNLDPVSGITSAVYVCDAHSDVVTDPDKYALAVDDDGITAVHACAINGYLETLKVLIEVGGASPFTQVMRSRVDALQMARRRGHAGVLDYLTGFQGKGGAQRLSEIATAVATRREETAKAKAIAEGVVDGGNEHDDESQATSLSAGALSAVNAAQTRQAKAEEARSVALARSMQAIAKEAVEEVELLPRVLWRAEYIVMDNSRGVGYYPRKPFSEGED